MTNPSDRIEYLINIFHYSNQRALALPSITPEALIESIADEFQDEIPYLGRNTDRYFLQAGQKRIPSKTLLSEQVQAGSTLSLVETVQPLPSKSRLLDSPLYLREENSGYVYKIGWAPAIIGRNDPEKPDNELVSADLSGLEKSLMVSRRHIELLERGGNIYARSLSPGNKSTIIKRNKGEKIPLVDRYIQLEHEDRIFLNRSKLTFRILLNTANSSD